MSNSQRAVAAALGVIAALMIVVAIWVRLAAPQPPRPTQPEACLSMLFRSYIREPGDRECFEAPSP